MLNNKSFLPSLAVRRPVTIIVTLLAIVVVGAIAYQKVMIELLPQGFTPPFLGVWVSYVNANPQEVEEQIARPVEEQVRTIPGVRKVETYSNSNGCWTWLEFAGGTDMDVAYDQLRDRMERARAQLPDDFERYYLRKFGRNDTPIIFMSLSLPEEVEDPYYIVEKFLKQPLERVDGVASIEIWGAQEKTIQILIDQDKVKAHRLNMFEVVNSLRNDNFAMSSGWVYDGDKKFIVRSIARFRNLEQIQKLPINEFGLKVEDVAEVKYDVEERRWTQRVNGKPALLLEIQKESLANSVAMGHKVRGLLDKQLQTHPMLAQADVNILFMEGQFIEDSIDNLTDTALWGGVFAILILMFFLRNLRMTLIMMVAIPLSVLISMMIIYFIGWTLNTITMMGLMISVGMVVDNGIVVLENIYRRRTMGESARDASISGASEVNLAIIMATLTTVAIFASILFMEDEFGGFRFYMSRIGLPIIFALLGSLFVALVLIPLATAYLPKQRYTEASKLIARSKAYYQGVLRRALDHRMNTVIAVIAIIFITYGVLMPAIPQSDSDGGNISDFWLIFDLPGNFTDDDANAFFSEVEDTLIAHKEAYSIKAIDTGFRKLFGRVRVFLTPPEKQQWYDVVYEGFASVAGIDLNKPMSREEVLEDVKDRIPLKPGVKFRTQWHGSGAQGEDGTVSVLLYGDDTGKLAELAEEVERRMRLLDGVVSVETDREAGADEIRISMDREIVTRNGINPNQVAFTLMYAVRGLNLPRYQAKDKEVEVRVQYREEDRENLEQLKNMTFVNNQGQAIPLSAIADFTIDKGFGQIARENGKTFLAVKAKTTADDLPRISGQIDQLMKDFTMPYGYNWQKGSRFSRFDQQNQSFMMAMIMAVILVYLLMAILFESVLLPIPILFTIPLAFFGAYLLLFITKTPIDIMAVIGIIILIGVIVNNGIVLIDMINRKRLEGLSRREAILEAGQNRFRPILMTSFTTIGGLIPMALGNASLIGMPYAPMGRALIGGMLTGTMLTLLVVPVFYTLFDDMALYFSNIASWFRGSKGEVVVEMEK